MASPGSQAPAFPTELDNDPNLLDLGDLFPLEGWAAAEPSILDSLGVGEISSTGHHTLGEASFATGGATFPPPPAAAFVGADASVATTGDTSQLVSPCAIWQSKFET